MAAPLNRLRQTLGHLAAQPCAAAAAPAPAAEGAFRFTADGPFQRLTHEQRAFYEENGYLVIPHLVPREDLARYKERFVDICEGRHEKPISMLMMRDVGVLKASKDESGRTRYGEHLVNKIQDYHDDDVLFSYCSHPNIIPYVQSFIGTDVKSVHTMLINKPPNVGESGRHPLHQDLHYFPFRPADKIVCSWTAMEPVTRANGCLVVLPGTHKGELLEHEYPEWDSGVNNMYHGISGAVTATQARVYAEMEPGDTIFFHPILIHGSGANKTSGYRKAISCHYGSSHCQYIEVSGTAQERIGKEIEVVAQRKAAGIPISFQDVFRLKSRLVAGEEDTL